MPSKEEIEKAYWERYIQKQNEAMEICKKCKYRKKVKELEDEIEKHEKDKKKVLDLLNAEIIVSNTIDNRITKICMEEAKRQIEKYRDYILKQLKEDKL